MIYKLRALPAWKTICKCLNVDRTQRPSILELVPMASDTLWIRNCFTDPAHESYESSDDFIMSTALKARIHARSSSVSVLSFHTGSSVHTRFSGQSINESKNRTPDLAPPLPTTSNSKRYSTISKRSSVSIGPFSMISSSASSFARFSDLSWSYSHLPPSASQHSSCPPSRRVTQELPVLSTATPEHDSGSSFEVIGSNIEEIPSPVTPTAALRIGGWRRWQDMTWSSMIRIWCGSRMTRPIVCLLNVIWHCNTMHTIHLNSTCFLW